MRQQMKPSLSNRGKNKQKNQPAQDRGSQGQSPKQPEPANHPAKGDFRWWMIAAVVVVAAIGIPLLAKMAQRKSAPAEDATTSSQMTPLPALPKFVDIGTTTCAPCKAMIQVMEELKLQFPGKLEVKFVNINEDRSAGSTYRISAIPTQIFYSPDGKELFRHMGFFSTNDVIATWKTLGYDLAGGAPGPGGR